MNKHYFNITRNTSKVSNKKSTQKYFQPYRVDHFIKPLYRLKHVYYSIIDNHAIKALHCLENH